MPRPKSDGSWSLKKRRGHGDNWHGYRRIDGDRQWISFGTEDAGAAGRALEDLAARAQRREVHTVADLLAAYLDDRQGKIAAWKRAQEATVALNRELGTLRPDQLDQARWKKYMTARAVSSGTLRRERNVLIAAFNLERAKQEEEEQKRIAAGGPATPPRPLIAVPKIKPPPEGRPRWRYLTRTEADRLLAAFNSEHARLLYTICLFTGCRKGQAIDLTWDRVDFVNNRIDFNEPERDETVKRRAVVPMGVKLRAAMLDGHKARTIDHVVEFAGARATKVRWPWKRARDRAGLGKEVTPHVLRHTAASWLAMAGIPIEQASDLLACDPKTLRKVYRKFDPEYLAAAVSALEGA